MRILPISEKVAAYSTTLRQRLAAEGIRVTLDDAPDKIGAKIRNARLDRVPYMLVVGQREAEEEKVAVRHRDLDDLGPMDVDAFVAAILDEIRNRRIRPLLQPVKKDTPPAAQG